MSLPMMRVLRGLARPVVASVLAVVIVAPGAVAAIEPPPSDGAAKQAAGDAASVNAERWIVQLREPAVARYTGGTAGLAATSAVATGQAKLDAASSESQAYRAHLRSRQSTFKADLGRVAPRASVQREYQVAVNGMAVKMSSSEAAAVRKLPGVRSVTPDVAYTLQLYATPEQIGAPSIWSQLGGQARAGEGVKIAILDSGIFVKRNPDGSYAGNPCFNDAGYQAPRGYPRGDTRFTNNKVIVARAYHRPGDPPKPGEDTPVQGTDEASPHGTHVAGIAACNANTRVLGDIAISGVAPRAFLMNYRVFYVSESLDEFQSQNAYVAELVQAIEDAVADGADVINGSWGSSYQSTLAAQDPMVKAVEAAVDAGVTVVLANGNSGPALATGNSPANSPKVIAVGAVTKSATLVFNRVDVTAPAPVPAGLVNRDTGVAQFGPAQTGTLGPAPIVAAQTVATNHLTTGCTISSNNSSPFPPGSVTGKIVLIERGICEFSNKVLNAQLGGAIGALVYNSPAGGDNVQSMGPGVDAPDVTIPSLFMRRADGLAMAALAIANPNTAQAQMVEVPPRAGANAGNVMAGFSSNGPTQDKTLKPDVVAPGVDVMSGGYATGAYPAAFVGFGSQSGTSMASPHVAGAAALLKQLNPGWKPADIKSALMTTANEAVFTSTTLAARSGVLARGAGAIDLSRASNPGLLLEQPSLSPGELAAGRGANLTLRARNARGGIGRWDVSVVGPAGVSPGGINVTVDSSLRLLGNVTQSVPVRIEAAPGTPLGDYEGKLVLTSGSTTLHVPFWLRVVPAAATKTVLLVDDDGSSIDPDFADFGGTYQAMLNGLGVSFDYLDIFEDGFLPLSRLQDYQAVLIFTGNNDSFDTSGFFPEDQDVLAEFLDSGGKLWTSGQNFAETSDSNTSDSEATGLARLYHGYLGLRFEDDSVFAGAAPRPTANGVGPMANLKLDVSPGSDGAGNQTSIEASSPLPDNDTFQAVGSVVPFFTQIGGDAPTGSSIAFGRSSDTSLSQPQQTFRYRSVAMGFGLEAVNSTPGNATRQQIARRALDWLLDTLSVSLPPTTRIRPARTTELTATASSSLGTITKYRWDFGDGSPIETTTTGTVEHRFRGTRATVRVEVADSLSHTAIATTLASVTGR